MAPYDAESAVSLSWMIRLRQNFEDGILDDCVERLGVERIGLEYPPSPREVVIGHFLPDFPYLERLKSDGFPVPLHWRFPDMDTGHVILTDEQQAAVATCDAEDETLSAAQTIIGRYEPISAAWFGVLAEVDQHPEIVALREEFSECVIDGGIRPEYAADEGDFLLAVDEVTLSLADDLAAVEREGRELGQLYYRCGVELFEREIELRLERRDAFLDEHWDDIVEMSQLLYDEGLITRVETRP